MRALLCVGIAYFLIGVLVPVANPGYQGELHSFTMKRIYRGDARRGTGAVGAVCIIFAFKPVDCRPTSCRWFSEAHCSRQRTFFYVAAPAENIAESVVVFGLCVGGHRRAGLVLYFKPSS